MGSQKAGFSTCIRIWVGKNMGLVRRSTAKICFFFLFFLGMHTKIAIQNDEKNDFRLMFGDFVHVFDTLV